MPPAIRVDNLSKRYHIGQKGQGYRTLRESLTGSVAGVWNGLKRVGARLAGKGRAEAGEGHDEFWALRDVSFEVQPGEVVGIIGRNGAGKSTLLKILSRITEPTSGRAEVRGRMGSLLEVGTGFHQELTGRENVYLNGSILGMSRREIDRKFDEIVAFSEIEQFLDTPVKRYSSGMYVRLAFAVAAHLDPDILVVDEVLAVGDAAFQRKCLGTVGAAALSGRTVLLVSHNMAAIQSLCRSILFLRGGMIDHYGSPEVGIKRYLGDVTIGAAAVVNLADHPARRKGCIPLIQSFRLLDEDGNPVSRVKAGDNIEIELTIASLQRLARPHVGIGVDDAQGARVCSWCTYFSASELPSLQEDCKIRCRVRDLPLVPGRYFLSLSMGSAHNWLVDALDQAVAFEVEAGDFFANGNLPSPDLGKCLVRSEWDQIPL
jgi:lipopolysaccharide transport system ATP-binding protein